MKLGVSTDETLMHLIGLGIGGDVLDESDDDGADVTERVDERGADRARGRLDIGERCRGFLLVAGEQDLLLVAEVPKECCPTDLGSLSDIRDRDLVVTAFGE